MTPIQNPNTPGLSRRKMLKTLTLGGLVLAAAGPLSLAKAWGWLTTSPQQAFTANASGHVNLKPGRFRKGPGMGKGKGKLGMNMRRNAVANNLGQHRKASV